MDFRNQIERRASQRFDLQLPVSFRVKNENEARGLTQDLSAAGTLLSTNVALAEGASVELTFVMPSEITFDGNMRVRCLGKVLRVAEPQIGANYRIAIHFEHYEFLSENSMPHYGVIQEHAEQEELSLSSHVFRPRGSASY
jgi:c-di-GMP-binding flagellar brake protein YcgR